MKKEQKVININEDNINNHQKKLCDECLDELLQKILYKATPKTIIDKETPLEGEE